MSLRLKSPTSKKSRKYRKKETLYALITSKSILDSNNYGLVIEPSVVDLFLKLKKKNYKRLRTISKKIKQIRKNPYHFKPLRGKMKNRRRVHVDKSFVLVYEIDEEKRTVKVLDFEHHDKVYE